MNKKWFAFFVLGTFGAAGCPSIDNDGNEVGTAPTVEFDPANKIVPFPNNLLIDPATGKVTLPEQCNESPTAKAVREQVLNTLDGFGTFKSALQVTFTEPVDPASLPDHVLLFKRAAGGMEVAGAAVAIDTVLVPGKTIRFDAACATPAMIDSLTIVAKVPLDQKSTYTVALVDGVKTATGADYKASFTWSLVRSPDPVVTLDGGGNVAVNNTPLDPTVPAQLAQLQGIAQLWGAHEKAMKFLAKNGHTNDSVLIAWEFSTQTVTDPLDATVAGSPASDIATVALLGNINTSTTEQPAVVNRLGPFAACGPVNNPDNNTQCFLKVSLGRGNYAVGNATCAAVGCAAVGDVLGSLVGSKQYMIDTPNPYTGVGATPIPGPWADPISPTMVKNESIQVLSFIPATPPPAGGYPTIVFQHGLGQSKTNLFAIASQLAGAGFASVAIDAVGHDSRAVRISDDPAIGCADDPASTRPDHGPNPQSTAGGHPNCYAPVLPSNLAAIRDGLRQTSIDQQRLIAALKGCGTTMCGTLSIDAARIHYTGQSLGGILGSITTAINADIKSAVLNVPGVGILDILQNTNTKGIQCPFVDGLIDAGIVTGDKSIDANGDGTPESGACLTEEWKTQPAYLQFTAIFRWVVDPGDPANYTAKLAAKKFLIQEVVDDQVVPNIATDTEGALVGQTPGTADPFVGTAVPSAAICSGAACTMPTTSKWVRYPTLPPDAATSFPGNTFAHGSLLAPANAGLDGRLGTGRMQVDAFTFLTLNK